jgi:xylulose-5-phosphate/fructose-6-phosphate phosphoketolase
MCVLNNLDRFQLVLDVIRRVPRLKGMIEEAEQIYSEAIERHHLYVTENGEDLPEVRDWKWSATRG